MQAERKVLLQLLKQSNPSVRKVLFKQGPINLILIVCELSLNFIQGHLKLLVKPTKTQLTYINSLSQRHISVERKRKFLVKPAGLKLLGLLLQDNKHKNGKKDGVGNR